MYNTFVFEVLEGLEDLDGEPSDEVELQPLEVLVLDVLVQPRLERACCFARGVLPAYVQPAVPTTPHPHTYMYTYGTHIMTRVVC